MAGLYDKSISLRLGDRVHGTAALGLFSNPCGSSARGLLRRWASWNGIVKIPVSHPGNMVGFDDCNLWRWASWNGTVMMLVSHLGNMVGFDDCNLWVACIYDGVDVEYSS